MLTVLLLYAYIEQSFVRGDGRERREELASYVWVVRKHHFPPVARVREGHVSPLDHKSKSNFLMYLN